MLVGLGVGEVVGVGVGVTLGVGVGEGVTAGAAAQCHRVSPLNQHWCGIGFLNSR